MTNLPLSRDFTLSPGDPVPSTLLNTLQDKNISGSFGPITIPIGYFQFRAPQSISVWNVSGGFYQNTGNGEGYASIWLPIGATVTGMRTSVRDDNTGTYKMVLQEITNRGASSAKLTATSAGTASDQDLVATGGSFVVQSSHSYNVFWGINSGSTSGSTRIYLVEVDLFKG